MINDKFVQDVVDNLATKFERELFVASIENITKSTSPIRFNNFAYAIRELTRHILARLAPDDKILKSKWYKNETGKKDETSRKQRIYYAIHGGLLPTYVQETLGLDIEAFYKKFRDINTNLSKHTHIEVKVFGINEADIYIYANETLETLVELFDFIAKAKESLEEALFEKAISALVDSIIEETFSSIDILATHHELEYVHTETLDLKYIDDKFIYFEAIGELNYIMQWGSDSDVSKGDGLVSSDSFPFKCKLRSNVLNPDEIIVDIDSIEIETDEDE